MAAIAIGAVLLLVGLIRTVGLTYAGIRFGAPALLGQAAFSAVILVLPGALLVRRGWSGRWL